MLTPQLARSIADSVASKIVEETRQVTDPVVNWQTIITLIVDELFKKIKEEAVIQLDTIAVSPANPQVVLSTAPGGGPVAGTISPSTTPVTGKIT
jgi:hypothetical protein